MLLLIPGSVFAQTAFDTVQVDFGSSISEGLWNNLDDGLGAGDLPILLNKRGLYTGISIDVYDRFNGINTGGTSSPDASLDYPSTATSDSYFGNSVTFGGNLEPTGAMLISGLTPGKDYSFEIFASRAASDNREAKYKFTGATSDSVLLNPSDNTANTVSLTMQASAEGTIDLQVSPGPNNDNSYGFYYLGALKMSYEQEEVLPPAVTLTSPNGGEELTGSSNYSIYWEAINLIDDVVLSYSTNSGNTWTEIATLANSESNYSWAIPDISSSNSLIQVVSGSASDQSDSVFSIVPSTGLVYDTVKVDFGSAESLNGWNNFMETDGSGDIPALMTSAGVYTGISATIFDRFNGINENGTTSPDANLGLPSTATSDSYYGNTPNWAGREEPTAGIRFDGMTASKEYTFEVFASRNGVGDNRETKYKFIGAITDSIYLNPSNNATEIATITLMPAADGSISLEVSAGENNTNSYSFYYLGALKLIYEFDASASSISVISPNGGEEWTKGTEQEIKWASSNVDNVSIEYSTDNGNSWSTVATTAASTGSYTWMLPDVDTDDALIKISDVDDPDVYDVSNSTFKIDIPVSGAYRPLIVVLGSSTSAGSGASVQDSAWVWRYENHIQAKDNNAYVVNLAVGGYNSYNIMPSDFSPPTGRPSSNEEHNITKALTYDPSAIIINLPSNDATSGYTIEEQIFNMKTVTDLAAAADVPVWVTTTQPRNLSESGRANLIEMRDSILAMFGEKAINIFDPLAETDGTVNSEFDSGDGTHVNDAGHKIIFDKVVESQLWEAITVTIGIDDETGMIPSDFELKNNYPNPFNPSTNVEFSIPVSSVVDLRVYDITGREVSVLVNGSYSAGNHTVTWDATGFATGMYVYQMTARSSNNQTFTQTRKMMLIK